MKGQQRKYSKGQDAEWWQEMQGWGRQRKREGRGRRGKGGNKRESREPEGGGKERREGKERAEGRKGRGGVGRRGRERWREGGTERDTERRKLAASLGPMESKGNWMPTLNFGVWSWAG